jgi:hypothetical protein
MPEALMIFENELKLVGGLTIELDGVAKPHEYPVILEVKIEELLFTIKSAAKQNLLTPLSR